MATKKKLITVLLALLLVSNVFGQTFHLILIADTKDPKIGKGCEIDHWTVFSQMKEISEKIGYSFNELIVSKDNFNLQSVNGVIDELTCESNDIIFLYYSGHGFNTKERASEWPIMNLKSDAGGYELEKAHEKLKTKGAGLCITLGDLCNEVTTQLVASLETKGLVVEDMVDTDPTEIFKTLFSSYKGDVLIASSSKGQFAWSTRYGSFYTQCFLEAINTAGQYNSTITWDALLKDADNRLQEAIRKLGKVQKPQMNLQIKLNVNEKLDVVEPKVIEPKVNKPKTINTVVNDEVVVESKDTVKSVVAPAQVPVMVISHDVINSYLNSIINDKIPENERMKLVNNCHKYFINRAKIKIYTNKVFTDLQAIEDYVEQKFLNNKSIIRINFIQKLSKFNNDEKKYSEIAVQEIWTK